MTWLKHQFAKLIATAVPLFFMMLIPAIFEGTLPLWLAFVVGFAAVLLFNFACGILLDERTPSHAASHVTPAAQRPRAAQPVPSFRVVTGGRAA